MLSLFEDRAKTTPDPIPQLLKYTRICDDEGQYPCTTKYSTSANIIGNWIRKTKNWEYDEGNHGIFLDWLESGEYWQTDCLIIHSSNENPNRIYFIQLWKEQKPIDGLL